MHRDHRAKQRQMNSKMDRDYRAKQRKETVNSRTVWDPKTCDNKETSKFPEHFGASGHGTTKRNAIEDFNAEARSNT